MCHYNIRYAFRGAKYSTLYITGFLFSHKPFSVYTLPSHRSVSLSPLLSLFSLEYRVKHSLLFAAQSSSILKNMVIKAELV